MKWLKIGLLLLLITASSRLYYKLTDDFRISNITLELPFNKDLETPDLEPNHLNTILDQEYTYLGKGAQSYAFASQDGKYVIKFFKFKLHKPNRLLNHPLVQKIPIIGPHRAERYKTHKQKLDSAFNGYKMAYDDHKEESGLISIHLNQTTHLNRTLTVKDKLGFSRKINLDQVVFIIQKKTTPSEEVITKHLRSNEDTKAKEILNQLFAFYHSEFKKGLYDRDPCMLKNTGFLDKKPIHFDVGKLTRGNLSDQEIQENLDRVIFRAEQWFTIHFPEKTEEMITYLKGKKS